MFWSCWKLRRGGGGFYGFNTGHSIKRYADVSHIYPFFSVRKLQIDIPAFIFDKVKLFILFIPYYISSCLFAPKWIKLNCQKSTSDNIAHWGTVSVYYWQCITDTLLLVRWMNDTFCHETLCKALCNTCYYIRMSLAWMGIRRPYIYILPITIVNESFHMQLCY